MDMILNGEICRKAIHKMTGMGQFFFVQISQISEPDQLFCDLSNTNPLAIVSHRIQCIWIINPPSRSGEGIIGMHFVRLSVRNISCTRYNLCMH